MKKIKIILLSLVLSATASPSFASEQLFTAEDGFVLNANYFEPKATSDAAVLMLHQCNFNQSMYQQVGKKLAKRNVHALSLDFRGFGKSVTNETNIKSLAKLPREEQRKGWRTIRAFWPKDVQHAYDFLRNKVGAKGNIGIIGASCGGGQAKILAQNNAVKVLAFFSSGIIRDGDKSIELYKKHHAATPTLFIDAIDDGAFTGLQKAFKLNTHKESQFITYKGDGHGYPLFDLDPNLTSTITKWFSTQLNK